MAAYSMDLRSRVLEDRQAGLSSEDVAAKYRVSRSWVDRVLQRFRERGETGPRHQTTFRERVLKDQDDRLKGIVTAQPDRTLREVQAALQTSASLTTIWRALGRLKFSVKKNRARR